MPNFFLIFVYICREHINVDEKQSVCHILNPHFNSAGSWLVDVFELSKTTLAKRSEKQDNKGYEQ